MLHNLKITSSCSQVQCSITPIQSQNEIDLYHVSIAFPATQPPVPVKVEWEEDMVNILHVWRPLGFDAMHQWFAPTKSASRFCCGAPVLTTIAASGMNSRTVAVSDAATPITLSFFVKDLEQRDKVGYAIEFFSNKCDPLQTYSADIRIDRRAIAYSESIMAVSGWWKECGYHFPPCPAEAEDPLYSSWYNFHQAPEAAPLLADLEVASQLGFRTVILDDGWQFDGPSTGHYSSCGEWTVAQSKFPDFRGFSDAVHALGMKLMVWFSVPFIGDESPLYHRFAGKFLFYSPSNRCYTLDPRYPEVRAFLIDTYASFLRKYDIDGFKLDFIDSFAPGELTADFCEPMDCATVDQGVRTLLTELESTLAAIKPDLLFEYRQNYVGPAINRFGNMLRVCDCAYDAQTNRVGIVNLRLLNYPIAVHSDMLLWSAKEDILLCARQLLNILFSVPQISVILKNSTPQQQTLLENFLRYWSDNRDILLHGQFKALNPELNYPYISAEDSRKRIVGQYTDMPYTFDGKACDVFVCTSEGGLLLENPTADPVNAAFFDCMGRITGQLSIAPNTIARLPVPPCGMAQITLA